MRQIFAIALITIRSAIRSKVVLSLLLILTAVIILLPFSIHGDGTASGFIQILISYTLGLSAMILSLTTLWAGCASVSSEIVDKTIQMVATKPVSTLQVWTGKWTGINLLNAGLIIVCGSVTYGMLHWHLQSESFHNMDASAETAQILSARTVFLPIQPSYEMEIDQRLAVMKSRNDSSAEFNEYDARQLILKQLTTENNTVPPGGQLSWNFGRLLASGASSNMTLEFRFSPSVIGASVMRGRWLIGTTNNPSMISFERESVGRTLNSITFSSDERWTNAECIVSYENIDDSGVTLLFDIDSTALLVPSGGFTGNYIRALLIIYGKLSFLTALGVTAGCLFSLPVASFLALFLLLILQLGSYINTIAQTRIILPTSALPGEGAMSWGAVFLTLVFKGVAFVISPLQQGSPLNDISTGRMINYAWTINGLVVQGIICALIMGCISSYILSKRELALPST